VLLRTLGSARDSLDLYPPAVEGDLYCLTCRWFFAVEMLEPEGDPMALDGIWRCPTHGRDRI
jgi:hypothetical protein